MTGRRDRVRSNRRVDRQLRRAPRLLTFALQSPVVDHDAAVLDDVDARLTKALGRQTMMNSELHPDGFGRGVERENLVDVN